MLATVLLGRTIRGFEIRVVGAAPRAARFSGFNADRLVLFTFAVSGALAGLAGIIEVAGPIGHLDPGVSSGYGFTAIIVAFLGRLNPVGILVAGLFLALTFIGGEGAQISIKVPLDLTKVFQGILLFYVLACDSLIVYRIRLVAPSRKPAHADLLEAIISLSSDRRLDAAAAGGGRRTGRRTLGRAQSRRRGHDDHGRGLRLRRRLSDGVDLIGALCGILPARPCRRSSSFSRSGLRSIR